MGAIGGQSIREQLDKLREEIREYYGQLNELRMGAISKAPRKPEFLSTFETYKRFDKLPYAGGMSDQPYLWVIEFMVIDSEIKFMEMLASQASAQPRGQ